MLRMKSLQVTDLKVILAAVRENGISEVNLYIS